MCQVLDAAVDLIHRLTSDGHPTDDSVSPGQGGGRGESGKVTGCREVAFRLRPK